MIPIEHRSNPLCLLTHSYAPPDEPAGTYVFCNTEGVVLHQETFTEMHRAHSVMLAHALIQADLDALYSRTPSQ